MTRDGCFLLILSSQRVFQCAWKHYIGYSCTWLTYYCCTPYMHHKIRTTSYYHQIFLDLRRSNLLPPALLLSRSSPLLLQHRLSVAFTRTPLGSVDGSCGGSPSLAWPSGILGLMREAHVSRRRGRCADRNLSRRGHRRRLHNRDPCLPCWHNSHAAGPPVR